MRAALAALLALAAAPLAAQPSRDAELRTFLQERFAEERVHDPDTRYASGWADLNGDDRAEAFVYLTSGSYCGSGGCDLFIFTPEQNSFQQFARMSVTSLPIRALNSRTRGWRDLAVTVSGGGAPTSTMLLAHIGGTYPDNPTVAPARTLRQVPPGEIVIAAGDRGHPLF